MCFDTTKNSKPSIAKKNIVRYKRGFSQPPSKKNFSCMHQKFEYEPEKLYTLKKALILKSQSLIHSDYACIYEGFHSYNSLKVARQHCKFAKLGKFIIPKGATYYMNKTNHESVSDAIIFRGFIPKRPKSRRV